MCDGRLFEPQMAAFAGYDPVVLPLDGHGSVAALARDVLAAVQGPFALAGLSMGGIVAMEVARMAPERVLGLALLDTNHLAERSEIAARRGPQMAAARAGRLSDVMRDEMKPNYLTDGPQRGAILDLCMDMALGLGPEVFCRQSMALRARPDQTETLRGFGAPSLVLCGRDDALCPVSRHEAMAALLPEARLSIVEGAGHLPVLEQPEATNIALREWLARTAGA